MDEHMGKRAAGESFTRRLGIASRDQNNEDGSSRHRIMIRGTQIGTQEKSKYARVPFNSMIGKAIAGSSSRPPPASHGYNSSFKEQQNQRFPRESSIAEISSEQGETEDLINTNRQVCVKNLNPTQRGKEHLEHIPTTIGRFQNISEHIAESSISGLVPKPHSQVNGKFGRGKQDASSSSFVCHSTMAYTSSSRAAKPVSQRFSSGAERCGLNSLNCTSTSDVLPSGILPSDFRHLRSVDTVRKRSTDGESSAARRKGTSASSSRNYVVSMHDGDCSSSSSMDQVMHQPVSRRTRNRPTIRDGPVSVRTRRASTGENQRRLSVQDDDSTFPLDEPIMIPQYQWAQFSSAEAPPERSSQAFHKSYGWSGSSSQASQSRLVSHPEDNSTQMFYGSTGDGYHRFNMEEAAEMLMALEQIEQDAALTYEQLLVMETSLLFRGLNFHDQHRDLRMDIDNMSYEELLALEEKMGTVSTALSEEQMSKCFKRSLYAPTYQATGITVCSDDDMKCSICQEEYVGKDEVGRLGCGHLYHVTCIEQWLRQKNWCPICKSSALPS